MQNQNQSSIVLKRRQQVTEKTGLSRSAIYGRMDEKSKYYDPNFPRPVKLGNGKNPPVAWIESEIDAWIMLRAQTSRPASEAAARATAAAANASVVSAAASEASANASKNSATARASATAKRG